VRSGLALFETEKNIEHRRKRMVENYKKWSLVTRFDLLELLPKTPNRTARVLLGVRRAHFKIHLFPT
jgi:hypothetical protein